MDHTPKRNATPEGHGRLAALIGDAMTPGAPDSLSPARRSAVLASAVRPSRFAWFHGPGLAPRLALAAAAGALMLAVTPVLFQSTDPASTVQPPVAPASTTGLEVFSDGDDVVLRWESEGTGTYRVIRATDPRDLGAGASEVIEGNSWKDPNMNGSRVVFYRVEELEG